VEVSRRVKVPTSGGSFPGHLARGGGGRAPVGLL